MILIGRLGLDAADWSILWPMIYHRIIILTNLDMNLMMSQSIILCSNLLVRYFKWLVISDLSLTERAIGVWQQDARCWFLNTSDESLFMIHRNHSKLWSLRSTLYLPMKFVSERRNRGISPLLRSIFWFSPFNMILKAIFSQKNFPKKSSKFLKIKFALFKSWL